MSTTLSNAIIVQSNSDPAPRTSPASGSDGNYTWQVVGQNGAKITLGATNASLSTPSASTNNVTANAVASTNGITGYVQVTAAFGGTSNQDNWTLTVNSKGGTAVRFVKGNGGGY